MMDVLIKEISTFSNSGPNSITGFAGLVLAIFRTTTPSSYVYRFDCGNTEMRSNSSNQITVPEHQFFKDQNKN